MSFRLAKERKRGKTKISIKYNVKGQMCLMYSNGLFLMQLSGIYIIAVLLVFLAKRLMKIHIPASILQTR